MGDVSDIKLIRTDTFFFFHKIFINTYKYMKQMHKYTQSPREVYRLLPRAENTIINQLHVISEIRFKL